MLDSTPRSQMLPDAQVVPMRQDHSFRERQARRFFKIATKRRVRFPLQHQQIRTGSTKKEIHNRNQSTAVGIHLTDLFGQPTSFFLVSKKQPQQICHKHRPMIPKRRELTRSLDDLDVFPFNCFRPHAVLTIRVSPGRIKRIHSTSPQNGKELESVRLRSKLSPILQTLATFLSFLHV